MPIIGTNDALAIGPQTALGAALLANDASWGWLPYTNGTLGPISNQENLPPEVSGSLLPAGAYKTGYVVGGQLTFVPRLNSDALHWLLGAFASGNWKSFVKGVNPNEYWDTFYGAASTLVDPTDPTAYPTTGKSSNAVSRYLSAKALLSLPDGTADGEIYNDMVVSSLVFQAVDKGTMNMQAALLGRGVNATLGVSGANWTPGDFGNSNSVPLTCVGTIQSPAAAIDMAQAMRITINNTAAFTPPADVQPHFSYSPTSFSILARNATFVAEFNLEDYDLPRQIFYNGGTTWSPVVWTGTRPFMVEFRTPANILANNTIPAFIRFWARDMAWAAAPIETSGARIKTLAVVGTVQRNETTTNGIEWYIMTRQGNDRTDAWPT